MKRKKIWMCVLLSTSMLLQTLSEPGLLLAATSTPLDNSVNSTTPVAQQNPSLDEINQKLETVAKEKGIPSILLKAIAYKESTWRQFDSQGNPLLGGTGPHKAIGIMQIATYNDSDLATIEKLKTDIDFNIQKGADLLNEKWAMVPKIGDGDRNKLENWYFALWAYNIWSGKNNPNEASQATNTNSNPTPTSTSTTTTTSTSTSSSSTTSSTSTTSTNSTSTNTGDSAASATLPVYQDRLLNEIANPPAWLSHYIQPVTITKIPASALPQQGVPQSSVQWNTPQPFHLGDLAVGEVTKFTPEWLRLQGTDRMDTAIQQAEEGWPQGSASVILARADDFPDALAGVPLAARLNAPVLLTSPQELDSRVLSSLKALHPQTIYLLGGEGALGPDIVKTLQQNGWNANNILRVSGEDRYDTASSLALATAVTSLSGLMTKGTTSTLPTLSMNTIPTNATFNTVPAVAIATGENFPDALSIASIAGTQKMPILLTSTQELPQETLEALKRLHPSKVYLIGGESVISETVEQGIEKALNLPSVQIHRLFGASRYETMAAVAQEFSGDIENLSFATGEDFPDALAGAAFAVHKNSAVILIPKGSMREYPTLENWVGAKLQSLTNSNTSTASTGSNTNPSSNSTLQLYLFGGAGAIDADREKELKGLLQKS